MGSDLSVIRSAKVSFAQDAEEWDEVKHPRLINYLARGMTQGEYEDLVEYLAGGQQANSISRSPRLDKRAEVSELLEHYRHTPLHFSPFCHTAITLRLKAPIAIHAQMMKHTVGFAHNTVSRRYVRNTPELFVPTFRHAPDGNVKQGSGEDLHEADNRRVQKYYIEACESAIKWYNEMIEQGVSAEQARFILPQGVMTEWISTGSLYAWARFYNLRTDHHAQKEIQSLAEMVGEIIEPLYPHSWKALTRR